MAEDFILVAEFPLLVPSSYRAETRLDEFGEQHIFDGLLSQQGSTHPFGNFGNRKPKFGGATAKLSAEQKLIVKVFRIAKNAIERAECLDFLRSQHTLLVGWEGASLVWEQAFDLLANLTKDNALFFSLDESNALYKAGLPEERCDGTYGDVFVDACLASGNTKSGKRDLGFAEWGRSHKTLGSWCYLLCFLSK